jgi:hypothetical protein
MGAGAAARASARGGQEADDWGPGVVVQMVQQQEQEAIAMSIASQ